MNFLVWLVRGLSAVLLCASLNGCLPSVPAEYEEEKEAHYLAGKNCLSSMDYGGAIESFEKAVEVNPRSASGHFQLGCLYEEKQPDPAAAIYHYEQFLKLRPASNKAEFVRLRINNCKQDLVKTLLPMTIPAGVQRDFEQMAEENKRLRDENEKLHAQLAARETFTNPAVPLAPRQSSASATGGTRQPISNSGAGNAALSGRTHLVQSGETPVGIAKKYGVKLDELLRANPGLDPKRMRAGTKLNIPSR